MIYICVSFRFLGIKLLSHCVLQYAWVITSPFWKTGARDLFLNTVFLSDKNLKKKKNTKKCWQWQSISRVTGNRGGTLEVFASELRT